MANLALLGGEKAVTLDYEKVGNLPIVSQDSIQAVNSLLQKNEISMSPIVNEFENKFKNFVGADYAIAMNNGTATLHSALFAVGVMPGDEVIVPSYTFWATVIPITSANATPIFCDVDKDTFNIDPEDIERKITPKTKAIMLVHVWGSPCDMDSIMAIAKKHNLKVIEDCSHAHGAKYKGKCVGTIGDVGCFSLQGSKMLVAGEGGIMVTNDQECYERAMAYGHYERLWDLPDSSFYKQYKVTGMGYKYRAHPLGIAIATTELDRLNERNHIRNSNGAMLESFLADINCLIPQKQYDGAERLYAYHYMNYDSSKLNDVSTYTLLKAFSAEGMLCGSCGYGALHNAPIFEQGGPFGICGKHKEKIYLPVTEELAETTVMIAPRFEKECPKLIEQYANAIHKVIQNADELLEYEEKNNTAPIKKAKPNSINIVK